MALRHPCLGVGFRSLFPLRLALFRRGMLRLALFGLATAFLAASTLTSCVSADTDVETSPAVHATTSQRGLTGRFPGLLAAVSAGGQTRVSVHDEIDFSLHRARAGGDFMGSGLAGSVADTPLATWRGSLWVTTSDTYTFFATTNDAVALTIDDIDVIDDWNDGPVRERSGAISLTAGEHTFEFRSYLARSSSLAAATLEWASTSSPRSVVPASAFSLPTSDVAIPPVVSEFGPSRVGASAATIGVVSEEATTVSVEYGSSPGYGLSESGSQWGRSHTITLSSLPPDQVVYYRVNLLSLNGGIAEHTGTFRTRARALTSGGLVGAFETDSGRIERIDRVIEFPAHRARGAFDFFASGLGSSDGITQTAHWSGLLFAEADGIHLFHVGADDGHKLVVSDRLVTFDWTDGGETETEGQLYLARGWHQLDLYLYNAEHSDLASGVQERTPPGGSRAVIPSPNLSPRVTPGDSSGPAFGAIGAPMVGGGFATIEVLTDEPATATVEWGPSASYGARLDIDDLSFTHLATLPDLEGSTTYHYRVTASDAAGNITVSGDRTFVTREAPEPGGWGPPPVPGGTCWADWCASIGDLAGDACYLAYSPWPCGGCPRPACGATNGGCLQPWCSYEARVIGDGCRGESATGRGVYEENPCWYCGENCVPGTFREPPAPEPDLPGQGGLIGYFQTDAGENARIVPQIDFAPHNVATGNYFGSGLASGPNSVSYARFEGLIKADRDDLYTFVTTSDDGVYLFIDGHPVISDWNDGGSRLNSGSVNLTSGWHTIEMRVYNAETDPQTEAVLSWSTTTNPIVVVVPSDHLAPHPRLGDDTPPRILWHGPRLVLPNDVVLGVQTDEATTIAIDWGLNDSYGRLASSELVAFEHTLSVAGLEPNTTYHYRVRATDMSGNTTVSADATFTTVDMVTGLEGGLLGHFETASDHLYRVDPVVDFSSHPVRTGGDFFYSGLATGDQVAYSTWSGLVLADDTQEYIFSVQARDGLQLTVDSDIVILDWTEGNHWKSGSIVLTAGWHAINLSTFVAPGSPDAEAILRWQGADLPLAVIPQDHLRPASHFGDDQPPVIESVDIFRVTQNQATVRVITNEVCRVFLDFGEEPTLDRTTATSPLSTTHVFGLHSLSPDSGHLFQVTATDLAENTAISEGHRFRTAATAPIESGGLWGVYRTEGGEVQELVPVVDFPSHPVGTAPGQSFGTGLGDPNDAISAQWTGLILADSDDIYTFQATTDDGVKLLIDNRVVIGDWTDGGERVNRGSLFLSSGWPPIQMFVFNEPNTPTVSAVLEWSTPSQALAVVPQDHLLEERPPQFTFVGVFAITETTAELRMTTDEVARVTIDWGESSDYTESIVGSVAATEHTFPLTGLTPDTTYHFTAEARDPVGNLTPLGSDRQFRTLERPAQPPTIVCPDHVIYRGESLTGLSPGVFPDERFGLCWAQGAEGSRITGFEMWIKDQAGAELPLIEREYPTPRLIAAPGCEDDLWCDRRGSQELWITNAVESGEYDLIVSASADNGTRAQRTFPLVVIDFREAIVRTVFSLERLEAVGDLESMSRTTVAEVLQILKHALGVYDNGHLPTVLHSLRQVHHRQLTIRDELDDEERRAFETLLTELNTAAVLHVRRLVDYERIPSGEAAIRDHLDSAWANRDVTTASQNALFDSYWSLARHRVVQHASVRDIEARLAEANVGLREVPLARDLIHVIATGAAELESAVRNGVNTLGHDEAAQLAADADELAAAATAYSEGRLGNYEIADFIRALFALLAPIEDAEDSYLGSGEFRYYVALSSAAIVDLVIGNAEENICGHGAHPLIRESRRRWSYLRALINEFQVDQQDVHLAEFVSAVVGPDGTWASLGDDPPSPALADPGTLCFIAAVYNAAYTAEGDGIYYADTVLTLPGCSDIRFDWYEESDEACTP